MLLKLGVYVVGGFVAFAAMILGLLNLITLHPLLGALAILSIALTVAMVFTDAKECVKL